MATSSSIFYRIIRAGIGVFCLLGLTKVMFVSNISDTSTPSLQPPKKRRNRDTIRHYVTLFARFRLKMCYCSWPPKGQPVKRTKMFMCSSPNPRNKHFLLVSRLPGLTTSSKSLCVKNVCASSCLNTIAAEIITTMIFRTFLEAINFVNITKTLFI